jgi:hypothetical protein
MFYTIVCPIYQPHETDAESMWAGKLSGGAGTEAVKPPKTGHKSLFFQNSP